MGTVGFRVRSLVHPCLVQGEQQTRSEISSSQNGLQLGQPGEVRGAVHVRHRQQRLPGQERLRVPGRAQHHGESKGKWDDAKFAKNKEVMANLWNEIAELADFNKDGEVTVEEFKKAIQNNCTGKAYADFPKAFKAFIEGMFKTVDIDGDGAVGLEEFRFDCVNRNAYRTVDELNQAYEKLLTEDDKKKGGITLERYQELYAQFIGNPDESCSACYLFGPLTVLD